jgi:N-methylhydantoinase A/oxoprolinase/acetone carboxylase beta subunit
VWRAATMPADAGHGKVIAQTWFRTTNPNCGGYRGDVYDLHMFDARTNQVHGWKIATTPADPSLGLMQGLREASDRFDFALADVGLLMHGTTVATNAVLERKLARGLLVTTEGFGLRIAAPILPRLTPVSLGQSETRS